MKRLVPVLMAALIALGPTAALAEGDETRERAAQFVETLGRDLIGVVAGQGLTSKQRDAKLRELLHRGLDRKEIGRFVLGSHWDAASGEQLREYKNLFAEYLIKTYSRMLRKYEIKEVSVTSTDDGEAQDILVQTRVELFFGLPVEWSWRLRENGTGYRVVDVVAGGVSMASVYRSEFGSVVKSRGLEALIKSLRKQTGRKSLLPEIAPAAGPSIATSGASAADGMTY